MAPVIDEMHSHMHDLDQYLDQFWLTHLIFPQVRK